MARTACHTATDAGGVHARFEQFLLTRFNYRCSSFARTSSDPLKPSRLRQRLQLLEGVVLPSIASQTSQNFTWVLIVDKDLPEEFRQRLRFMLSTIENAVIVDYQDDETIFHINWLTPFLRNPTQHIITTNVDDDDAIHIDYVQECQTLISNAIGADRLPSIFAIGSSSYLQWDIVWGRSAPQGYVKPWSRSCWPTNAGLTLCVNTDVHNISVLALNRHTQLPNLLEAFQPSCRDEVHSACETHGERLEHLLQGSHFHDVAVDSNHPRILVGNHFLNDQISRIFESRDQRKPFDLDHVDRFRVNEKIVREFVIEHGIAGAWIFPRYLQVAWKRDLRNRRKLRTLRAMIRMPAAVARIAWNILSESAYSRYSKGMLAPPSEDQYG